MMEAGALLVVSELHQYLFPHTMQLEFSFEAICQIGIILMLQFLWKPSTKMLKMSLSISQIRYSTAS